MVVRTIVPLAGKTFVASRGSLMCDACHGPRRPCLCRRADAVTAKRHCPTCGYPLRWPGEHWGRKAA